MSKLEMKYFVLSPKSKTVRDIYAKASRIAMQAYSKEIKIIDPELSHELADWASKEHFKESELALNKKYDNET